LNLEVGCGSYGHTPILETNYLLTDIHKTKWNKRFVQLLCDVQHLPFQDESFGIVYASHVLEHVPNPLKAVREMLRVARKIVLVKVPHMLSKVARQDSNLPFDRHLHVFRRRWFTNNIKSHLVRGRINHRPFLWFFNRPYENEIRIFKVTGDA
jgi:ubiquinone/menaquinone biosynthesis C-methylase UbiE